MSRHVTHCQKQLSNDEISSISGAQFLDFYDPNSSQETLFQVSDANSGIYPNQNSPCLEIDSKLSDKINTETTDSGDLSGILDSRNDIPINLDLRGNLLDESWGIVPLAQPEGFLSLKPPIQPPVLEENYHSFIPNYRLGMNSSGLASCWFPHPSDLPVYDMFWNENFSSRLPVESSGNFSRNVLPGSQFHHQLEYQSDIGGVFRDPVQHDFVPGNFLALADCGVSGENQNQQAVMAAVASSPPVAEITGLEGKTRKLSVEERKEKIQKYLQKKKQRNFTKKIKYACRKTLADSRPRIRGRFAKIDEIGEAHRECFSAPNNEDGDFGVFKEEGKTKDSSTCWTI